MDTYVVVANAMMMMTMVISPFLLLLQKVIWSTGASPKRVKAN